MLRFKIYRFMHRCEWAEVLTVKAERLNCQLRFKNANFGPLWRRNKSRRAWHGNARFFFSLYINEKFPYDSTNISKPNWVDIKQVMKMKFLLPEFSLNKNPKWPFKVWVFGIKSVRSYIIHCGWRYSIESYFKFGSAIDGQTSQLSTN